MELKSTFFSERNASILFSTAFKFIKRSIDYNIGEQGENILLTRVMETVFNENPNDNLLTLNKKSLDVFNKIVSNKITEIRTKYQPIQENSVDDNIVQDVDDRDPVKPLVFPETTTSQDEETTIVGTIQESEKLITEAPPVLDEYYDKHKMMQYEYVNIDSRERDAVMYPNPNNYRFVLYKEFHNVVSIELITAEIPTSQYTINNSNNTIYFQEDNTINYTTAVLSNGNYLLTELKTAIETAMNNASTTGAIFAVDITTYERQNKLSISSDIGGTATLFNLLFTLDNNIGVVLGFSQTDLSGASMYIGDKIINLSGEQYILLKLDNIKNIQGKNRYVQDTFAKISLNTTEANRFFSTNGDYSAIKNFPNPVSSIAYFDISFWSFIGPYDFNGVDHSFTLKVSYINALSS